MQEGPYAPPVHLIKLRDEGDYALQVVHPDEEVSYRKHSLAGRRGCIRTRLAATPAGFHHFVFTNRRAEPMPARRVRKDQPHGMISHAPCIRALHFHIRLDGICSDPARPNQLSASQPIHGSWLP
jgi:hypothetical protein